VVLDISNAGILSLSSSERGRNYVVKTVTLLKVESLVMAPIQSNPIQSSIMKRENVLFSINISQKLSVYFRESTESALLYSNAQ